MPPPTPRNRRKRPISVALATLFLTSPLYDLNCFTEVPEWRCAATKVNNAMATDYDAPRKTEEESPAESLEALQASRGGGAQTAVIDVDENDDTITNCGRKMRVKTSWAIRSPGRTCIASPLRLRFHAEIKHGPS